MWLPAVKVSQTMHINVIMSKVVRSAKQRLTKLSSMHVYCSNDCLMIFLSTAQSQYSFQCFMICVHHSWVSHSPVVCHNGGQSLTPAIVMHSHHVPMVTIASSVALFNQSSQTESTRVLQTQPAIHWSAWQRHQQSERHSLNLLEVISDFPWLCPTIIPLSIFKYVHVISTANEGRMGHCDTVSTNYFCSSAQNRWTETLGLCRSTNRQEIQDIYTNIYISVASE